MRDTSCKERATVWRMAARVWTWAAALVARHAQLVATGGGALLLATYIGQFLLLEPAEDEMMAHDVAAFEGRFQHTYSLSTAAMALAAEELHEEAIGLLKAAASDARFGILKTLEAARVPEDVFEDRRRRLRETVAAVEDYDTYVSHMEEIANMHRESLERLNAHKEHLGREVHRWRIICGVLYIIGAGGLLLAEHLKE
jgi:hypothetical protein